LFEGKIKGKNNQNVLLIFLSITKSEERKKESQKEIKNECKILYCIHIIKLIMYTSNELLSIAVSSQQFGFLVSYSITSYTFAMSFHKPFFSEDLKVKNLPPQNRDEQTLPLPK
jgi:hypothetical protein